MSKGLRRRLFYILIVMFFLLGSGAVMYAQGWRPVLDPFGLAKVGAIYIRTFPADAELVLDDKMRERRAGLFERGTFLSNLLPGTYDLRASAPGFQPWNMQVSVSSSLVTTLRYVVLVPAGAAAATSTPVQDADLAGPTLVLSTAAGLTTLSGAPVAGSEFIAGSEDGTVILTYAPASNSYLAVDLAQATTTNLGRLAGQSTTRTPALSFQPIPENRDLFLARASDGLSILRASGGVPIRLATTSISATAVLQNRVFWTEFDAKTNMSLLSFYDIPAGILNSDVDSLPGRMTDIFARDTENLILLADDGSLYSLGLGQSSRGRLAQDARMMVPSNDEGALAVLGEDGIEVHFLRSDRRNARFNIPDADEVQELVWYRDNEHLFVIYPDRVAFMHLADTALMNFPTAAASGLAEYQPDGNILYFLQDEVLYALAFPQA